MKVTKCSPVCIAVHQGASSVGLKRPKAEVAQLSPWLFKDNCIGIYEVPASRLSLGDTNIMQRTTFWDCLGSYLCMISVSAFSSFVYCLCDCCISASAGLSREPCSCVFKACLSDRVQSLIPSLLGSHEYACQPYLSVQSQMCRLLCHILKFEVTF